MYETSKMQPRATLRMIAEHVGLTPGTISAVLNNTRAADRIPQHTRERVISAAREMNYSPNPLAQALRSGKSARQEDVTRAGATRGALVIVGNDQFERAMSALRQAGLRVPEDVSVVDLLDVPATWEHPTFASAPEYPEYKTAEAL